MIHRLPSRPPNVQNNDFILKVFKTASLYDERANDRMQKTIWFLLAGILIVSPIWSAPLPKVKPHEVGMDAGHLTRIDKIVEDALAVKNMPGCVVCIGRHGKIAFLKSYGNKKVATENDFREISTTTDTVYDLASLTKPIATATGIMILAEQGKIEIDAPVSTYLSEFRTPKKKSITTRQLLLHTAGFIPDNDMEDYLDGPEKAIKKLLALEPISEPGSTFSYSDVSFQMLGILIERISGTTLSDFTRDHIFTPLGMDETVFCPKGQLAKRTAPTINRKLGEVHDPRAFKMNGIAGHAGLFSTVDDLAVFASMLLGEGRLSEHVRILKPETVHLMKKANLISGSYRALGWDMQSRYSGNRGKTMSPKAFGHGGFTGTSLWIDPIFDLFVIFLSNRVHPDGNGNIISLAGEIGTIAVDSIIDLPDDTLKTVNCVRKNIENFRKNCVSNDGTKKVLAGIDVLCKNDFSVLKGKRVGLITNHTGLDQNGISVAVLLKAAPEIELVALFSPEHGFTGIFDQDVPDGHDTTTGLNVFSLYGEHRKPTPEMLENVDVLVFDIQDIGVRFYTYIATMLGSMESAAMKEIPFVVLDRPNPIDGDVTEGPLLDPGLECLVGCFQIPVRHGMTVGELALMMNIQRRLGLELHVVPCCGWKRGMDFDATGLSWTNPSPNMRSLTEAFLYPGVGLLEFTNLSVGRGTSTPFELLGAPWIDENHFVTALKKTAESSGLIGVRFEPIRFTPEASKFKNESCGGVRFVLDDSRKLNSLRLGMVLATTLRSLYPSAWDVDNLNSLLLCQKTCDMILDGKSVAEIEAGWTDELKRFNEIRKLFLLYDYL